MKIKPVSIIRAAAIALPLLILLYVLISNWGYYFPQEEIQIKHIAENSNEDEFTSWNEETESKKSICNETDSSCEGCPYSGTEEKGNGTGVSNPSSNEVSSMEKKSLEAKPAEDEFSEFDEFQEFTPAVKTEEKEDVPFLSLTQIIKIGTSYILIILAAFFVRSQSLRKFRIFFLLAGLIFFGFYYGGCPCPIMSFFKIFLVFRGELVFLNGIVWIVGLLFLTYFLGKTWCGWICPLGALQEILHRRGLFKLQENKTLQKSLRIVRYFFLVFFSLWVLLTGEILLSLYDPFKPVFNLFYGTVSTVLWILIGIMVISSIIIYRPFCKTVCPLGVVLGWISRLPGARRIKIGEDCTDCMRCERNCQMKAIIGEENNRILIQEDCIFCGDCIDSCNKDCICP
ncbi:MAG: 4Fe-4S binding protein [Acidobacteria bacterium]|nr:4Fe-4S binding protein [Acidobacteriota bacterium]